MDAKQIELLLEQQKTTSVEISEAQRKFKRDGSAKKNQKYCEKRLKTLNENWSAFVKRDEALQLEANVIKDQPYVKNGTFAATETIYNELLLALSKLMKEFSIQQNNSLKNTKDNDETFTNETKSESENDSNDDDSDSNDGGSSHGSDIDTSVKTIVDKNNSKDSVSVHGSDIDADIKTTVNKNNRASKKSKKKVPDDVQRFFIQYDDVLDLYDDAYKTDESTSFGTIEAKLKLIENAFVELKHSHREVRFLGNGEHLKTVNMIEVQNEFTLISGKMHDLLRADRTPNGIRSNPLPTVKIPEFDGTIGKWKPFITLFDEMVHAYKTLDNAIKMQYLKTSVKGEASRLISHVSPIGENYKACYELLRKRYENKRELTVQILDKIFNLSVASNETSKHLKMLHDTVRESIMEIQNMKIKTDDWDIIIIYLITKKLHADTIKHYECQLGDVRQIQKLDDFFEIFGVSVHGIRICREKCSGCEHNQYI